MSRRRPPDVPDVPAHDQRARLLAATANVRDVTAARFLNNVPGQPKKDEALKDAWTKALALNPSLDWAGTRYGQEVAK